MAEAIVSEREQTCIRILAALFEQGEVFLSNPQERLKASGLELAPAEFEPLMQMMQGYGVITSCRHTTGKRFAIVTVTPEAVRLVRDFDKQQSEAQKPKDIVTMANDAIRKHPVAGWLVVSILALTALLAFVNQVIQFLKNVGWMK